LSIASRLRNASLIRSDKVWFCCTASAMYDSLIHICHTYKLSHIRIDLTVWEGFLYRNRKHTNNPGFNKFLYGNPGSRTATSPGVTCHYLSRCAAPFGLKPRRD
jgi:hypothetical protein